MHANSPIGHVDLNGGFVRRSATILCPFRVRTERALSTRSFDGTWRVVCRACTNITCRSLLCYVTGVLI